MPHLMGQDLGNSVTNFYGRRHDYLDAAGVRHLYGGTQRPGTRAFFSTVYELAAKASIQQLAYSWRSAIVRDLTPHSAFGTEPATTR